MNRKRTGRNETVCAALAVALLVAVAVTPAAAQGPSGAGAEPRSVIVDTDAGLDDLMALAFLLASPEVRLEAVCIGTGLAHIPAGAAHVLNLLELAGRGDVPVYLGRATPLAGHRAFPDDWRRRADELPDVRLPRARRAPEAHPAAEYLAARLRDTARPVEILALGGLTNLAEAFARNPAGARAIRRLVIMGGALRVPGNLADGGVTANTTAEWNIYIDPEAARRVFASGAPIRLVPLDAANRVPIDAAFARAVEQTARAPLGRAVAEIIGSVRDFVDSGSYFAWDPLAAAALVDPAVVRLTRAAVDIRLTPPEDGRTVIREGAAPNAEVALDADARRFRDLFLRALSGRSR